MSEHALVRNRDENDDDNDNDNIGDDGGHHESSTSGHVEC
jgi:hypothetical protein